MKHILPNSLTFFLLFFFTTIHSQEIWHESFTIPEKGVWGDINGSNVNTDFEGITKWTLDFSNVVLQNPDDYAKTVSTSGGRFECRDTNGEVVWKSETIDISEYKNIMIGLEAAETGSGNNTANKYLKAYYILDNQQETLFDNNGENLGNWGSVLSEEQNINGNTLQIIVYMNNHYASDKVILDEIAVRGEEKNPVNIEQGDVLITEVLFNPVPDGEDFVELYNHSEKRSL